MAETWKKLAFEDDVVLKTLFDAQSVLSATGDDTPAALVVAEQELVGRITGGNVDGIAIGIADNNILQVDGTPVNGEAAVFTAAGINSLSEAEFKTAFNIEAGVDFLAYDAGLANLAGVAMVADRFYYTSADDVHVAAAVTAFARSILDDADEATFKATVNLEIGTDVLAEQTIGIADNNLMEVDSADAAATDYAKFTANGLEGRSFAEVLADLSGQAAADFAMNTHKITGVVDPAANQDAATKAYVDSIVAGFDIHGSCRIATNAALPACTPAGSGVGKTLTANAVGILTVDGIATVLNNRILVKNQAAGADNGIYKVTTEGTAGVAFVLTRTTDFDADSEVTAGAFVFVAEGTVGADHGFVLTTNDPITVDTTALAFAAFSSAGEGIPKSLFDADTFLYATSDDTPVATSPANVLAALTVHAAAAFDWNGQQLQNMLLHIVADDAARDALSSAIAMVVWHTTDACVYVCTEAEA